MRAKNGFMSIRFHHSNFQNLNTYPLNHDLNVSLCEVSYHKLTLSQKQGADLTMDTIYGWTMEYKIVESYQNL